MARAYTTRPYQNSSWARNSSTQNKESAAESSIYSDDLVQLVLMAVAAVFFIKDVEILGQVMNRQNITICGKITKLCGLW